MTEERKVVPPDDTFQRGQSAAQTSQNDTQAEQVAQRRWLSKFRRLVLTSPLKRREIAMAEWITAIAVVVATATAMVGVTVACRQLSNLIAP